MNSITGTSCYHGDHVRLYLLCVRQTFVWLNQKVSKVALWLFCNSCQRNPSIHMQKGDREISGLADFSCNWAIPLSRVRKAATASTQWHQECRGGREDVSVIEFISGHVQLAYIAVNLRPITVAGVKTKLVYCSQPDPFRWKRKGSGYARLRTLKIRLASRLLCFTVIWQPYQLTLINYNNYQC